MKRQISVLVLALVLLVTAAVPAVFSAQDGVVDSSSPVVSAFLFIDPECPTGSGGGGANC